MYCLATLLPDLKKSDPDYHALFFTENDKKKQIDLFYQNKEPIPLCLDHKAQRKENGFTEVAKEDRIGRVVDLFNNNNGQMMLKLQLDPKHKAYGEINQGIFKRNEKWGVSVWIDGVKTDRNATEYQTKKLTHVALTKDPLFANHNTYLHDWQVLEPRLDKVIAENYCNKNNERHYAAGSLKDKLKGVFLFVLIIDLFFSNYS